MMIKVINRQFIVSNSLQGVARNSNQDDVLIINHSEYDLYMIFDGVSSINTSISYIQECKKYIYEHHESYLLKQPLLKELIYDTHMYSLNFQELGKSTCCALVIYKTGKAYIVNIGDSRIYAFSNCYLEQLSTDDSICIDNRSFLTKCLGMDNLSVDDIKQLEVEPDQNYILCSDGFYSLMEIKLKRYFQILQFKRGKNILNAINQLQIDNNKDDSTYIIIKNDRI